jgi:tyrosyl-tRNA synthetase
MKMIFQELIQRNLIKQSTNHDKIKNLLDNDSVRFYIGFDPTADSLHVGHLVQIVTAKRLQNAGHEPIMLLGGATASIGDPTGKSDMRKTLKLDQTMKNAEKISQQIYNIMGRDVEIVNNIDWFHDMNFMEFISDIGRHFSVNQMLKSDCFKSRMENGLSFLEFNYMLMQGFDFLKLNYDGCLLQIGGDDQWSNILAGIDLIHKKTNKEAFGLTITLLTNSVGQKMGKTEKGTVWLDKKKTGVFDFFQFWINLPDEDVINCFKLLTFLSPEEIDNISFSSIEEKKKTKKTLAVEMTRMIHGESEAMTALKQAEALFETKDNSVIDSIDLLDNVPVLDLLVSCNFARSKTDARNLINGRGISINDKTITDPTVQITKIHFGNELIVRKGKKNFCRIIIKDTDAETQDNHKGGS